MGSDEAMKWLVVGWVGDRLTDWKVVGVNGEGEMVKFV